MGRPPCNFPVSLSKDEVSLEEAQLNLHGVTPRQREGVSSDREGEALHAAFVTPRRGRR